MRAVPLYRPPTGSPLYSSVTISSAGRYPPRATSAMTSGRSGAGAGGVQSYGLTRSGTERISRSVASVRAGALLASVVFAAGVGVREGLRVFAGAGRLAVGVGGCRFAVGVGV